MSKIFHDYAYGWVIGALFLASILGQWIFGWFDYVNDQTTHNAPVFFSEYFTRMITFTLENWQSEFLQLLCQVGLLTWLLFKDSPQSRDQQDRMERKIDEIRRAVLK